MWVLCWITENGNENWDVFSNYRDASINYNKRIEAAKDREVFLAEAINSARWRNMGVKNDTQ